MSGAGQRFSARNHSSSACCALPGEPRPRQEPHLKRVRRDLQPGQQPVQIGAECNPTGGEGMSVIVTLSVKGNAKQLEEYAASNSDAMEAIVESAKGHGLIAHRFYGSEDGEIMVIDEWPDAQSFESFFQENSEGI